MLLPLILLQKEGGVKTKSCLILCGHRCSVSQLIHANTVTSKGLQSQALQCDLCYSWVHAACEGISRDHCKALNQVLSTGDDNFMYLCQYNYFNTWLKQLLATKISSSTSQHPHDSIFTNLSSKADNLSKQSTKLETDLTKVIQTMKVLTEPNKNSGVFQCSKATNVVNNQSSSSKPKHCSLWNR